MSDEPQSEHSVLLHLSPSAREYAMQRMMPHALIAQPPPPMPDPLVAAARTQAALENVPTQIVSLGTAAMSASAAAAVHIDRVMQIQRALSMTGTAAEVAASAGVTAAEVNVAAAGGGTILMGPVGVIAALLAVAVVAGGVYLAHSGSAAPRPSNQPLSVGVVPADTPQPAKTPNVPADTPSTSPTGVPSPTPVTVITFAQPQYLIHATGHMTYDGPVTDDSYLLFPVQPDAQGHFAEGDGSGGLVHYASDYHSGPYATSAEVCAAGPRRNLGELSAWTSNYSFTCQAGQPR